MFVAGFLRSLLPIISLSMFCSCLMIGAFPPPEAAQLRLAPSLISLFAQIFCPKEVQYVVLKVCVNVLKEAVPTPSAVVTYPEATSENPHPTILRGIFICDFMACCCCSPTVRNKLVDKRVPLHECHQ
ncbi:hypothetical protein KGM_205596 [Danaus plexippus plexippus]|uniref:Uncharacterized protein n=1 Tax=Danaus plexippus plexippus TaxID=278856 RepID=A0A212F3V0_DANPL|nr:hypothetical protein KGM_205596 [Danaus plexippus plexippus]